MKLLVTRSRPGLGECEITLEVYQEIDADDTKRMICAVYQLTGQLRAPPKAWLRVMREELATLETIAREAGCVEMRMAGRFKQNIFPDYQPYEPASGLDGLRKELT